MPAENEHTLVNHETISGITHGAHGLPPEGGRSAAAESGISRNARSDAAPPVSQRAPSAPDQRDGRTFAEVAIRGADPSGDRSPGNPGEDAQMGSADPEGMGAPAAPVPAGRESSTVSATPGSGADLIVAEPSEPAPPPATRGVSLHLADGESSVDIRMAEHAGEIRVTVHTPDREMADSMRADLPELVGKLRQGGFQAEVWRPAATAEANAGRKSSSDGAPFHGQQPGSGKDGRQRQPQQPPQHEPGRTGEWEASLANAQECHT